MVNKMIFLPKKKSREIRKRLLEENKRETRARLAETSKNLSFKLE